VKDRTRWCLVAIAAGAAIVLGCRDGRSARPDQLQAPRAPIEPYLTFVRVPEEGRANQTLELVEVAVFDSQQQLEKRPTIVQLDVLPNREGGRLLGTVTAESVDGIATFHDVNVDRGGTYRLRASAVEYLPALDDGIRIQTAPLHVILMIADGWGFKQIEAQERYTGHAPFYTSYTSYAMSTYDVTTLVMHQGVGYDPARFWSVFEYATVAATDSAASATAMYTGDKTYNGRIDVSIAHSRLQALPEMADLQGLAVGAVTSVPLPHATPGAWLAHNDYRENYYAIADEMLWRDPNTTGNPSIDPRYAGSYGPATLDAAVIIAGGHPAWCGETYMRTVMRDKLQMESGQSGKWTFVQRIAGQQNGGMRLLNAANSPSTQRLCGVFGGAGGNIEFRRADGSGASRENPTLAEMTTAALTVLQRRPAGFALMVEGGAIDFAGHANQLDNSIGEMIDFEAAVQAVVNWVDSPSNAADWSNTLLIVTGDHECGYLTAGPRVFPDVPFTEVSPRTLALEKAVGATGRRASWEDWNSNNHIDAGEPVYWCWHTGGHSNSLIPLYVRGVGSSRFGGKVAGTDPVRGGYIDDTAVFQVMRDVLQAPR